MSDSETQMKLLIEQINEIANKEVERLAKIVLVNGEKFGINGF
jgi:hypothetical protein